ncbi:MAG: response regulator [Proteobacteria bacterium]|nr:response regulator [Pseudomonadota bacterium]MCP4921719.1 response regulator [Pseudomonadota bacterium]
MALRILLIDDEVLVRRSLARQLRPAEVVVAGSGEEALEIIANSEPFDGILCDLLMKGMDGIQVLARLRVINPGQAEKLVFLSGSPGQSPVSVSELGVRFEDKPVSADTLREIVESWKD